MLIIKAFSSSAVSKFRVGRRRKQKATEQQLAKSEEEEEKGECGTKLDFASPLLEKLVEFADGTWGLFELLLQTDPLPSEEDNALRSAWNGLRDVAN